jgi:hypothetical protein
MKSVPHASLAPRHASFLEPLEPGTRLHPPATLRVAMRAGRCGQVASYSIEPLEARVAPAAVVTYTDTDGDVVKITASNGPLDAADLTFVGGGIDGQLATLNLTDPGFDGARIIFSVTKKPGGDGVAHVGFINADGVDLDRVVVKGDLGRILAGDATTADDPGLNLLQVRTMGTLGLVTQGGTGFLSSTIVGKLGALKVAGDFTEASIFASGLDGQIGSVFIGGDLTGGVDVSSGTIGSNGAMGNVRVGGDVIGGVGDFSGAIGSSGAMGDVRIGGGVIGGTGSTSGRIFSSGAMGNVRIGGDIIGGADAGSGQITSEAMGDVRIGGGIIGGTGGSSGEIFSVGAMGDVRIGGDLIGGMGNFSGVIYSNDTMGDVRLGGNLIGGSISGSASLNMSGVIFSTGRLASVTLGGSLIAGHDLSTGTLTRSGAIVTNDDLGPVKIGGSVLGDSTNLALISAKGQDVKPTSGFDTTIASLMVTGDVRFAQILAGFNTGAVPANADAAIGTVKVGHDWVASSLVAGAQDAGGPGFGVDDTLQTVGDTPLIARIASITIKGSVSGSLAAGDNFGFVAQQIDRLAIAGRSVALNAGPSNDNVLIAFTDDVHLLEV